MFPISCWQLCFHKLKCKHNCQTRCYDDWYWKIGSSNEKQWRCNHCKLADVHDIHREYLGEFVRQGKLERIAHGIYITPDVWEDKMLIHQLRKDKRVYSHETALFLNDLTDRDPVAYCITVPTRYNTSKLNQDGLIVHTVKKELFNLGICTRQTTFGNDIRIYEMERTIYDILRDRMIRTLRGYRMHSKNTPADRIRI